MFQNLPGFDSSADFCIYSAPSSTSSSFSSDAYQSTTDDDLLLPHEHDFYHSPSTYNDRAFFGEGQQSPSYSSQGFQSLLASATMSSSAASTHGLSEVQKPKKEAPRNVAPRTANNLQVAQYQDATNQKPHTSQAQRDHLNWTPRTLEQREYDKHFTQHDPSSARYVRPQPSSLDHPQPYPLCKPLKLLIPPFSTYHPQSPPPSTPLFTPKLFSPHSAFPRRNNTQSFPKTPSHPPSHKKKNQKLQQRKSPQPS